MMHDMATTRPGRRGRRMLATMRWAVIGLLLAAILGACGGGDDTSEASAAERAADLVSEIPAPTDDAAQPEDTFVGLTEDGAVGVALVVDDDAAVAYICDGKELGHWFKGGVDDDEVNLEHEAGTRIEADIAEDEASGEITLADGSKLAFTAPRAEGAYAGFFRSTDLKAGFVHGWIVIPDGTDQFSVRGLGTESKTRVIDSAVVVDDVVPSDDPVPPKKAEIEPLDASEDLVIPLDTYTCDQLEDSFNAIMFAGDHATSKSLKNAYYSYAFSWMSTGALQGCDWAMA